MNLALMIIDLQKAYYNDENKHSIDSACEYINAILPLFRKANLPVFWVQHISDPDGVVPGANGFELIDLLQPEEGEYRIHKKYGNTFNKTNCLDIMNEKKVDTVILTGYCAEYCVLSTYRGAKDHDLTPIILRNSLASNTPQNIKFVEKAPEVA